MQYRLISTNEVFHAHMLREKFPNTSLPAVLAQGDLAALGLEEVPDTVLTPEEILAQQAVALVAAKAAKHVAIKAERDRRKFNGVSAQGKWIHSDTYSRTQWLGMFLMGAGIPAIEWTTMDGTSITTSQTLAGQVFQGIAVLDASLFAYAKSLMAAVDASTDPDSINITTGWPATYEGAV